MKEKEREVEYHSILQVMGAFHQLNFGALLPDMTKSEFCLLKNLEHAGKKAERVKVSALVRMMNLSAPAVSRSLRSLEEKGWTKRQVDEKDRRNTYVEITASGEAKLEESTRIMQKFQDAVWSRMGQDNMEQLVHYLSKLQRIMKQEIEAIKNTGKDDGRE